MTLIMDAAARSSLVRTFARIAHVLDDVAGCEPALARRIRPVRSDVIRFLRMMDAPDGVRTVEDDLDRLIDSPGWHHPVQILGAYGVDYGELAAACRKRFLRSRGRRRRRIKKVLGKIEHAQRLAEKNQTRQIFRLKDRIEELLDELPEGDRGG